MKTWLPWTIIVLFAVILGFSISRNMENRARIAAMRDSLHIADSLSQILNYRADSVQLQADTLQAKLDASNALLYTQSIHNAAQEATSDSLVAVISAMDSSAGAQIGTAIANLRGEIALCHSTLGICDSLNGVLRTENGVLTELSLRNSATITTLREAWEAAERRSKQSNWGIGATCGIGFQGPDCVVGLSYRVRLPKLF